MDSDSNDLDQLETPPSRWNAPAAVVAVVVVVVLVVLGVLGHEPHGRSPQPSPSPTPVALPEPVPVHHVDRGSVFLAHLPECTARTPAGGVSVSLAVTNLSDRPLRLVRSVPLYAGPALRFTSARIGSRPCARDGRRTSALLAPSQAVVVALSFRVVGCPRSSLLAARVTFMSGDHLLVHADSAGLADMSLLRVAGCT